MINLVLNTLQKLHRGEKLNLSPYPQKEVGGNTALKSLISIPQGELTKKRIEEEIASSPCLQAVLENNTPEDIKYFLSLEWELQKSGVTPHT